MSDFFLRPYRENDEERFIDLLIEAFDEWKLRGDTAFDYWRWLYLENPPHESIINVAVSDNEVIGVDHSSIVKVKLFDEVKFFTFGNDTVVRKDHRRRGISKSMRERKKEVMKKKGLETNYLYSDSLEMLNYHRKHSKEFPFKVSRHVKIKNPDLHVQFKPTEFSWIKKAAYRGLEALNIAKADSTPDGDYEIRKIDEFDNAFQTFWEKISPLYDFIVVRDQDYLNWRFMDKRAGDYFVLAAWHEDEAVGYIVNKIIEKTPGYPEGFILDILCHHEHIGALWDLISTSIEYYNIAGINSISCACVNGHPYQSILNSFGFVNQYNDFNLYYWYIEKDEFHQLRKIPRQRLHFSTSDLYLS